ncbi:MAG: nucleotide exchange factor GrpE [Verrucomicrobiota bacterium]
MSEATGKEAEEMKSSEEEVAVEQAAAESAAPNEAGEPEVAETADEAVPVEEVKELTLEEQLEKAKAEAQENYNEYLRARADLDTYRRRVIREKDELRQYAVSGLLESLLPVYDNMGLGMLSANQTDDAKLVAQGFEMVLSQFKGVMEENGVAEVEPKKGDEFDHNLHEAMQTQVSDEVEDGKILQLIRKGFTLNGRLVRPATVIVAGKKEEA